MEITVELDTSDWERQLDLLLALYNSAARDASVEAAELIQGVTRESLLAKRHPPHTKTPSAPGEPPAAISDDLAASVLVDDSDPDWVDVGPTTDYGRIQELGGYMEGHPLMYWHEDGRDYRSAGHDLPERPYLKPATDEVIDSGELIEVYEKHWTDAQEEATS